MSHKLLLDATQFASLNQNKDLLIIDLGSREQYLLGHIPGALHLDYATITGELPTTPGPLPEHLALTQALRSLGLQTHQHIIAYDHNDNAQACRFLWSLDLIEHPSHSLFNGGMQAYIDAGLPTEQTENASQTSTAILRYRQHAPSADIGYILQHYQDAKVSIIDARSAAEYNSTDVRAQRGGHIPDAINFDYRQVFETNQLGKLRPLNELQAIIEQAGIKLDDELICHCQSHRRSAVLYFVFKLLGAKNVKGYPGSWAEWGNRLDTPIQV